jgi:hypothetical protein
MAVAVDPKQSKQRFDARPRLATRLAKKKKPTSALGDDPAQYQLFWGLSDKAFREKLFADLCRFCRQNGGWVISPPNDGRAIVQVAEGSLLPELLAQWPRYPVVKLPNVSQRLQGGRFIPVTEIQVTLWRA